MMLVKNVYKKPLKQIKEYTLTFVIFFAPERGTSPTIPRKGGGGGGGSSSAGGGGGGHVRNARRTATAVTEPRPGTSSRHGRRVPTASAAVPERPTCDETGEDVARSLTEKETAAVLPRNSAEEDGIDFIDQHDDEVVGESKGYRYCFWRYII